MSDSDKKLVVELLGTELQKIVEEGSSSGLREEVGKLLQSLGLYEIPYGELKVLYLRLFKEKKTHPFSDQYS